MRGTELLVSGKSQEAENVSAVDLFENSRGVTVPDVKADHEEAHKITSDETERLTSLLQARQTELSRSLPKRIANSTYGVSPHCEEEILPKRMAAVPWAAFCI
jgi:RNA polymerase-binding transcription factor DksA